MAYMAIKTTYLGFTNYRPSRIKASCEAGSLIKSYDQGLSTDMNHREAARQLAEKFGWDGRWMEGSLDKSSNVYVRTFAKDYIGGESFVITSEQFS